MNPNFSDDSNDQPRVEHRYDAETPPSIAIVQAIAVLENIDPMASSTHIGIRLYDHVDPEALNRLVTTNGGVAAITVDLTLQEDHQYSVRIQDDGQLIVQKAT